VHLIKVRLAFNPKKARSEFQDQSEHRTFSFSIYPRMGAARRKSVVGRFGLGSGRFARPGPTGPPAPPDELE
jgi:hypothetical protein